MSGAALLAAAGAGGAVFAAWDLVVMLDGAAGAVHRAVAPLARGAETAPSVAERRRVAVLLASALLAAGWLVAGPLLACALAAGAPVTVRAVVSARRRRWRSDLTASAPLVARALADALSGGHSIRGALGEAAARGGLIGPVRGELTRAAHQLALGERTETVLEHLRARARSPAYDALVAAVLMQREAGGDLGNLLRELAASLEAGVRAAADARAVTAQARFTGALVAALPLGAAVLIELARPGFLADVLTFPPSAGLLVAALALEAVGALAVHRLSRIEAA